MPIKISFNGETFYLYAIPRNGGGYYCTFSVGQPNDSEMMRPYIKQRNGEACPYSDLNALMSNAPTDLQIFLETECRKMPATVSQPVKEFYERQMKELFDADFQKYHCKTGPHE